MLKMRRSSYTRPPGGNMMTPLRVSNKDNIQSCNTGTRRSSSTTRMSTSTGSGAGPMKRPRVQKVAPTAPAPRRSSIFGNGRQETGQVKDPRPLGDRNYRDRCIRKIVDFLMSEGYPNKITVRTLSTPNTKDVVHIYIFLFQYTDPDYKSKGKPEEEIPRMLAFLHYPFQLSRNHMFTVAAQHSWPHVLGGLIWLVDTILCMRNIDIMGVMFSTGDDFGESEKEVVSMHLATTYQDYLSGTDDFVPHEELLRQKMKERWQQGGNTIDKLQEKYRRLKDHLEEIRSDPDTLEARQERVTMLQTDIVSHTRYVQQMTVLHEQLVKQYHAKEQNRETQEGELEKIGQERKRKQAIIDVQGISPSDLLRMNAQKQELLAQTRVLDEQNFQINDQVCNAEIEYTRRREAADAGCSEVNNLARKSYGPNGDIENFLLNRDANSHAYKACFNKISQEIRNRVHKTETDSDKLKYKLEMALEMEDDLQKDLQVKQSANKTQADEYERFMKCERGDMDKMQTVLEGSQRQIDVLLATTSDDDYLAAEKIKKEWGNRIKAEKVSTQQYADFLHKAVGISADHKLKMKDSFKKIEHISKDPKLQPLERA